MKQGFFIFLFFLGVSIWAQPQQAEALDKYFDRLDAKGRAMGSFTIYHHGEAVYQRAFGMASLKPVVKADTLTRYRIGSISKTFTAVVIMQMVEEGKLSLDDKLARFYPDWPNATQITMEHLLRHQSGIHNFGNTRSAEYRNLQPETRADMEAILAKAKTDFRPGASAEYNNANYVVLSLIAEKLDSMRFDEILDRRIAKTLGLNRTGLADSIEPLANEAYSYYRQGSRWLCSPLADPEILLGAGGMTSTPTELCRFMEALFEGRLIQPALLEGEMMAMKGNMGAGLFRYPLGAVHCYGHAGSVGSFKSFTAWLPEQQLGVAICLNAGGEYLNDIVKEALTIYLGL